MKNIPVRFTSSAIVELQRLSALKKAEDTDFVLRIGVKGGGCAGLSYIFDFEPVNALTDVDEIVDFDAIKIAIHKDHVSYLEGIEVDFARGLNNKGFTFNNPNANTTCGCGTSFSA